MKRTVQALAVLALSLVVTCPAWSQTVIKLANSGPANPDNRTVKAVEIFANYVQEASKGKLKVQAYHASALGNEREALEGVKLGTIQMATLSSGPTPGFFAPSMVYGIPYLFLSAPAAWAVYESDFGQEFNEAFRKATGVRILGYTENGYRHFVNNKRDFRDPADLKGLKIRTTENPAHMAMVKAMGAEPTPIAFGELYMALQQGVVDGMELPVVLTHDGKYYEVQKYMTLDGHIYDPLFIFVSDDFFNKLSPDLQKVLADGSKLLAMSHNGFSLKANRDGVTKLREKGMTVTELTPEQRAKFKEVGQKPALEYIEGKAGADWVKKALAAADKAEKEIGGKAKAIEDETIAKAEAEYAKLKK